MTKYGLEDEFDVKYLWGFLAGLLAGSLVGAVAMLLLAPQSGRRTRVQIQRKSADLREQTADSVEDSLAQVRTKAGHITDDVKDAAHDAKNRVKDAARDAKRKGTAKK